MLRGILIFLGIVDFIFGLGGLVFGLRSNLSNYDTIGLIFVFVFFLLFLLIGLVFLQMGVWWKGMTRDLMVSMVSNIALPITSYLVFVTSPNDIGGIIHVALFGTIPLTFFILYLVFSPVAYFKYSKTTQ